MTPKGSTGDGRSFVDAPVNPKAKNAVFTAEVCAICTANGSETNLGCVRFKYKEGDKEDKFKGRGLDTGYGGWTAETTTDAKGNTTKTGCFTNKSSNPGKVWKEAIEDWVK